MAKEPFPFLDLPAELRLMVYEFIPSTCYYPVEAITHKANKYYVVVTRHHVLSVPLSRMPNVLTRVPYLTVPLSTGPYGHCTVTLVTKSLSLSILSTCCTIHSEAAPIFARHEKLRKEPMRLLVDYAAAGFCWGLFQLLTNRAAAIIIVPAPLPLAPIQVDAGDVSPAAFLTNLFAGDESLEPFLKRCVLYLSYAVAPDMPIKRARDLLVKIHRIGEDAHNSDGFYLDEKWTDLMLLSKESIGRLASSSTVTAEPRSGMTRSYHDLFQNFAVQEGFQYKAAKWQDEEQWVEEWEEVETIV